jgi:radical SAM protein with 4Fe4S-binding SPASM domain
MEQPPPIIPSGHFNSKITIFWDITYQCNLACIHCCVRGHKPIEEDQSLSMQQTRRMLANACSGREIVGEFNIQGGEPTLAPNLLPAIQWLGEHGIPWSMITNGTIWTDSHFAAIERYPPIGLAFSLDGANPDSHDSVRGRGSFDSMVRTVRRIRSSVRSKGMQTEISGICVLTKRNIHEFVDVINKARQLGMTSLMLNSLVLEGSARRNKAALTLRPEEMFPVSDFVFRNDQTHRGVSILLRWLTPLMSDYYARQHGTNSPPTVSKCGAIRSTLFITPNGHLLPCPNMGRLRCQLQENAFCLNSPETNLVANPLEQIRRSDYFARAYAKFHGDESPVRARLCEGCRFRGICVPCPTQSMAGNADVVALCYAFQQHHAVTLQY